MQTLAVVGASLAGLSAARAARAQGFSGRLLMIGDEVHRPYDRPPLSKDFLAGRISAADLALETADEDLQAEWLMGNRAVALDGAARAITLANGETLTADGIVLATGASARTLPELAGLANVFSLRTLTDAQALSAELQPGRKLVVVGAGFIGAEVASTAKALGLEVTVIESRQVPLSGPLGEEMGTVVGSLHGLNGVELICGAGIDLFHSGEGCVSGLRLTDGRYVPADLVVVGIGAVPNTGWLAGSGVETANGVACDSSGRTNLPGIVAVGDCAAWFDGRIRTHRRVEHWTTAVEHPDVAVAALLDQPAPKPVKVPYFWSDQYGVKLQFAGNAAQADRLSIEAGDPQQHNVLALYYRGEEPVAVLGMNQPKLFTKWRRSLNNAPAAAAAVAA
ncbi:ferredoxin reductase [Arthrobacter crystallopoietes BAB-32]|uniref:Ferredoxin reductase n=1 Tax=Arthrobacter crystallopoietes BAB-32 TaxID=1246476 RepID=N1V460_9MICC|nr:FAD-dependent oxidoreductase [Arthrobacter crystallopoietes]EMY34842.1 ferredoxin reductase [Arthrobacter crystallopoietes BAB-32]